MDTGFWLGSLQDSGSILLDTAPQIPQMSFSRQTSGIHSLACAVQYISSDLSLTAAAAR